MGKTLGYMLTFTTYGIWLQGDRRGYVKDGEIQKACERLEQANKKIQKGDTVILSKDEREIARKTILQEAERIGEKVLALSVRSNHVHIVIKEGGNKVNAVVNRLKTAAYYALKENGERNRIWTSGYDTRFCFDEKSLRRRIEYTEKHGGGFRQ